jgi:hypothetical protein
MFKLLKTVRERGHRVRANIDCKPFHVRSRVHTSKRPTSRFLNLFVNAYSEYGVQAPRIRFSALDGGEQ